nr:helix-turn-helix domain-containing protein [Actinosynnema mirum]
MTASPERQVPAQRPAPVRVLLTVEEAAERLGIGKTKAYALVKAGSLESVLIGRLRRVHVDAIDHYTARLVAEQSSARPAA